MYNVHNGSLAAPANAITGSRAIARILPAIALLACGLLTIYCVGFSTVSAAHNATHDTRHANGFPCH